MRLAAIAILAPVLFLVGGGSAPASTQVTGGIDISVKTAPWTVYLQVAFSEGRGACGGAILDARHVLTAAHCVYDVDDEMVSPRAVSVRAGISATYDSVASDAEQDRSVSAIDVPHDYITSGGSVGADDLALLTLNKPLDLTQPTARAVALPRVGAKPPSGAHVWLTGFGQQALDIPPDGALELINMNVMKQSACAAFARSFVIDDAAAVCARSATTSVCRGDSGSGLVAVTRPRTLVGILSAGSTGCVVGSASLYTYLGAPTVRRFIAQVIKG